MSGKTSRANMEKDCIQRLCKVLRSHEDVIKVSDDVRPGCSSTLRNKWNELSRGIGLKLQPQIDLLIETWTPSAPGKKILCGIEVKYFKKKDKKFNWSFYAGIDEAIATLNYGLDGSALWQIFAPSTTTMDLRQYGASFWIHVNTLKLPIEFSLLVDRGTDFDIYTEKGEYSDKLSNFPIIFNKPNPIKEKALQIKLRKLLYAWWKSKR